ncbi:hypothetical protein Kuura_031 [Caulobacter phage Kuura]|nr:hypothetical protein Kuura_031 [Caulobacter phage Kuura]
MVDFSQYLGKATGEITAPKALPPGHYYCRIKGHEAKESQGGRPMLVTSFTVDSAGEDVDTTTLPPNGVAGKSLRTNFMLDADFGIFAIKELIAAAGIEMDPAQGIGTYLDPTINQPVLVLVANRRMDANDPESREVEDIKKILPVT